MIRTDHHPKQADTASPRWKGNTEDEMLIIVHDSADVSRELRISDRKCSIGASEDCHVILKSPGTAPVHCIVFRDGNRALVRRWSPSTWLNGKPFVDAELRSGDKLRANDVEMEVFFSDQAGHSVTTNRRDEDQETDSPRISQLMQRLKKAESRVTDLRALVENSQLNAAEISGRMQRVERMLRSDRIRRFQEIHDRLQHQKQELQREIAAQKVQHRDERRLWKSESDRLSAQLARQADRLEHERRRHAEIQKRIDEVGHQSAFDFQKQLAELKSCEAAAASKQRDAEAALATLHARQATEKESIDRLRTDLEHQHAQLQSERAKLENELTHLELEKSRLRKQMDSVQADRLNESQREEFEAQLANLESEKTALRSEMDAFNAELAACQSERAQLQSDLTQLESEKTAFQQELVALRSELEECQSERAALEAELAQLKSEKSALQNETDEVQAQLEACKEDLTSCKSKLVEVEASSETNSAEYQRLVGQCEQLEQEREELALRNEELGTALESNAEHEAQWSEETSRLQEQSGAQQEQIESQQEQIESQQEQIESLTCQLEDSIARVHELSTTVDQLQGDLELAQSSAAASISTTEDAFEISGYQEQVDSYVPEEFEAVEDDYAQPTADCAEPQFDDDALVENTWQDATSVANEAPDTPILHIGEDQPQSTSFDDIADYTSESTEESLSESLDEFESEPAGQQLPNIAEALISDLMSERAEATTSASDSAVGDESNSDWSSPEFQGSEGEATESENSIELESDNDWVQATQSSELQDTVFDQAAEPADPPAETTEQQLDSFALSPETGATADEAFEHDECRAIENPADVGEVFESFDNPMANLVEEPTPEAVEPEADFSAPDEDPFADAFSEFEFESPTTNDDPQQIKQTDDADSFAAESATDEFATSNDWNVEAEVADSTIADNTGADNFDPSTAVEPEDFNDDEFDNPNTAVEDKSDATAGVDEDDLMARIRSLVGNNTSDRDASHEMESASEPDLEEPISTSEAPNSASELLAQMGHMAEPQNKVETVPANKPFELSDHQISGSTLANPTTDEDDSIEDYMAKLLERVGGADEPTRTPVATDVVNDESSAEKQPPRTKTKTKTQSMFAQPSTRRERAPTTVVDMEAMRELANASSRSAITQYKKKTSDRRVLSTLFTALIALLSAGILLILSRGTMSVFFMAGMTSLVVAAYFAYRAFEAGAASILLTVAGKFSKKDGKGPGNEKLDVPRRPQPAELASAAEQLMATESTAEIVATAAASATEMAHLEGEAHVPADAASANDLLIRPPGQ